MLLLFRFPQILFLILFCSSLGAAEFRLRIPRGPDPESMVDGYMFLNPHFTPANSSEKWTKIFLDWAKSPDQHYFIHALATDQPGIFSFHCSREASKHDQRLVATHTIVIRGETPVITQSRWKQGYVPTQRPVAPVTTGYPLQHGPLLPAHPGAFLPHQNPQLGHTFSPVAAQGYHPFPPHHPVSGHTFYYPPHAQVSAHHPLPPHAHSVLPPAAPMMYSDLGTVLTQRGHNGAVNYLRTLIASPTLPAHHLAQVAADLASLLHPPVPPTAPSDAVPTEITPARTVPTQTPSNTSISPSAPAPVPPTSNSNPITAIDSTPPHTLETLLTQLTASAPTASPSPATAPVINHVDLAPQDASSHNPSSITPLPSSNPTPSPLPPLSNTPAADIPVISALTSVAARTAPSGSGQHAPQTTQEVPVALQTNPSPTAAVAASGPNIAATAPTIISRRTNSAAPSAPAPTPRSTTAPSAPSLQKSKESTIPAAASASAPARPQNAVASTVQSKPSHRTPSADPSHNQRQGASTKNSSQPTAKASHAAATTKPTPAPQQRQEARPSATPKAQNTRGVLPTPAQPRPVPTPTPSTASESVSGRSSVSATDSSSTAAPAVVAKFGARKDEFDEVPASIQTEALPGRQQKKSNSSREDTLIRKARLALERAQREEVEKKEKDIFANLTVALNKNDYATLTALLRDHDPLTPLGKKLVFAAVSHALPLFTNEDHDFSLLCRHSQELLAKHNAHPQEHSLTEKEQTELHAFLGRKLPDPDQQKIHRATAADRGHVDSQAFRILDTLNTWEQGEGADPDTCTHSTDCPHKQARAFVNTHQTAHTFPCLVLQAALLRAVSCPHSGFTISQMARDRATFLAKVELKLRNKSLVKQIKETLENPLPSSAHQAMVTLLSRVMSEAVTLASANNVSDAEFTQLLQNIEALTKKQHGPTALSHLEEVTNTLIKKNLSPRQLVTLFETPSLIAFFPQFYDEAYGSLEPNRFKLEQNHHEAIAQAICKYVPTAIATCRENNISSNFYEYILNESQVYLETKSFPASPLRIRIGQGSSNTVSIKMSAEQFVNPSGVINLNKLTEVAAAAASTTLISAASITNNRTELLKLLEDPTGKGIAKEDVFNFVTRVGNTEQLLMICQQNPGSERSLKQFLPLLADGITQNRWSWFTLHEFHTLCEDLKRILTVREKTQSVQTQELQELQAFITALQFKVLEANGAREPMPVTVMRAENISANSISELFKDLTRRGEILKGISAEQVTTYITAKTQKQLRALSCDPNMTESDKADLRKVLKAISSPDDLNGFLSVRVTTVLQKHLPTIKTPQDVADFYAILKSYRHDSHYAVVTKIFEDFIKTLPDTERKIWRQCTDPVFNTLLLHDVGFQKLFRSFSDELNTHLAMIDQTSELVFALLNHSIRITQEILLRAKNPDDFSCVIAELNQPQKNIGVYIVILSALAGLEAAPPLAESKKSLLQEQLATVEYLVEYSLTQENVSPYRSHIENLHKKIVAMTSEPVSVSGAAAQPGASSDQMAQLATHQAILSFKNIFAENQDRIIPMIQMTADPAHHTSEPLVWIAILETQIPQPGGLPRLFVDEAGTKQRLDIYRKDFLERLNQIIERVQHENPLYHQQLLKLREDLLAWNTLNLEPLPLESLNTNRFITPIIEVARHYCEGTGAHAQPRQEAIQKAIALLKTIDPQQADSEAKCFSIALTIHGGLLAQAVYLQLEASGYAEIPLEVVTAIRTFLGTNASTSKRFKAEGASADGTTAVAIIAPDPENDFTTPIAHAAVKHSVGDDAAKENALIEIVAIAQKISYPEVPVFVQALCTHALLIKVPVTTKIFESEAIQPGIKYALVTQLGKSHFVSEPDKESIRSAYRTFLTTQHGHTAQAAAIPTKSDSKKEDETAKAIIAVITSLKEISGSSQISPIKFTQAIDKLDIATVMLGLEKIMHSDEIVYLAKKHLLERLIKSDRVCKIEKESIRNKYPTYLK